MPQAIDSQNPAGSPPAQMPAGLGNAYAFQVFNTLSFQIVLSVPMFLFFKQLGASATILGIVAALPNLLNILQIPAARFVEVVGYRKFVLRGWTTRSYLILGMAITAFLPTRIDAESRIALMLLLLFIYNASRGISVCGFLPWMTKLVPESIRGRYISRDQMSSSLASVVSLIINAYLLGGSTALWAYGGLFVFSFVTAMVSIYFLRKIPDAPVEEASYVTGKVPWKELMFYPPFMKFMVLNVITNCAFAGSNVFWIPMFSDQFHFTGSKTLYISSIAAVVSAYCLFALGRIIDRVGSRPVISMGLVFFMIHFGGWASTSAGVVPINWYTLFVIQIFSGLAGSFYNLANSRMLMGTVPAMGRSHFFALYSVITSLILSLMSIVWGLILDSMSNWHYTMFGWEWNKYSFFYSVLIIAMIIGQYFLHRLDEARAMPTDEFMKELLINTPSRALSRLLFRKPLP